MKKKFNIFFYQFSSRFSLILVTNNWNYGGFFLIFRMTPFMNHSKDNFKNNYLIFKPNYISFLITFFFSY
jgi:hypothetical protein